MAGGEKTNAYRVLGRILIVLLVFTAVAAVGFIYARNTVEQQMSAAQQQRDQQNAELEAQYNERANEQREAAANTPDEPNWPQPKQEGWDIVDLTNYNLKAVRTEEFEREALEAGGLMLINRWHYLPSDFNDERFENSDELVSVVTASRANGNQIQASDNRVRLLKPAFDALYEMLDAARQSGVEYYYVVEGYRTYESQEESFLKEQAKWENRFTGEVLIEKAREQVNIPGTSEFQTGLSFRIRRNKPQDKEFNSVKFTETEQSSWLINNSWEYGIVFRFPVSGYPAESTTDKSWKTGEKKSLMIYRYVGKAAATVMHIQDFCLEEFIEYMTSHPHIAVYKDGQLKYELYRTQDTGGSATVSVTANAEATASIDNMGGIIVSLAY